jgi:hypothetical protein
MSTEAQRICSRCGNEVSGTMEFCLVCMLHKALASAVPSGESSAFVDGTLLRELSECLTKGPVGVLWDGALAQIPSA